MKPFDAPLPMAESPAPPPESIMAPPADRAELLDLLTRLTQEAKMPDSVKNARFVRVPADLYMAAHDMVRRELHALGQAFGQ